MPSDKPPTKIEKDVQRTAPAVDQKFDEVKPKAKSSDLKVVKIARHGVSTERPWGGATLTLSDGRTVFLDARALEEAPWE